MIWWRCGDGLEPGLTRGSKRWTDDCAHPKRSRPALTGAKRLRAATICSIFIMALRYFGQRRWFPRSGCGLAVPKCFPWSLLSHLHTFSLFTHFSNCRYCWVSISKAEFWRHLSQYRLANARRPAKENWAAPHERHDDLHPTCLIEPTTISFGSICFWLQRLWILERYTGRSRRASATVRIEYQKTQRLPYWASFSAGYYPWHTGVHVNVYWLEWSAYVIIACMSPSCSMSVITNGISWKVTSNITKLNSLSKSSLLLSPIQNSQWDLSRSFAWVFSLSPPLRHIVNAPQRSPEPTIAQPLSTPMHATTNFDGTRRLWRV